MDEATAGWVAGLDDVMGRIAPRFGRVEPRRRVRGYLLGLLAPLGGKNGWTIAEAAGDATPDGMQRLLNEYRWDAEIGRASCRERAENSGAAGAAQDRPAPCN